jgi:hypothetical protein
VRLLPTTTLGVVVIALAALLVPGVRDQVMLSVSHRPEQYVELYFPRPSAGPPTTCTRRRDSVRVGFVVASHLDAQKSIAYRVAVARTVRVRHARVLDKRGTVSVDAGGKRRVERSFTMRAHHPYSVSVSLPALHQQLHARCPGGKR